MSKTTFVVHVFVDSVLETKIRHQWTELNWTELNWTDIFSEKNTGCTGQEEMPLTYTLQKQKVQSKLEHE